jgi:hypothetical protein
MDINLRGKKYHDNTGRSAGPKADHPVNHPKQIDGLMNSFQNAIIPVSLQIAATDDAAPPQNG